MDRSRNRGWTHVLVGLLATFLAGTIGWLGERLAFGAAKPTAEGIVAVALFLLYPKEHTRRWSVRLAIVLSCVAVALTIFWVAAFAWGRTRFLDVADLSRATIAVTLLSTVITAPLFEEKVVRDLLLRGFASLTNPLISTIAVSLAFALVHDGAVPWSFLFSLVLCVLTLKWNVGTLQRVLVHGLLNLLVLAWYATKGYGFFA